MAASNKPEVHHVVPRCLLTLHEKARGTSLDGEGIQAWLEWELEAMRWKVPIDIPGQSWRRWSIPLRLRSRRAAISYMRVIGPTRRRARRPKNVLKGPANHF